MKAIRLRTEYLVNPVGISIQKPRLMWNCANGDKQDAYQIQCFSIDYQRKEICGGMPTEESIQKDLYDESDLLWDSGRVESQAMQAVFPLELESRQEIHWRIRLWGDSSETAGPWAEASFEMSLLEASDFTAQWITGDYHVRKKERYPVDCFRKEITLQGQVQKARLYITACGLYEACLDGERIGDMVMAPGYTDYTKRVQLQTYDVTDFLKEERSHEGNEDREKNRPKNPSDAQNTKIFHTVTVELADGWYRGSCGAWGLKNQYGKETKLYAQLEVTYSDGSREVINTDSSWEWSNDGSIRLADNKDGEIVDGRMTPSYQGHAKVTHHPVIPTASNNVAVKQQERFRPAILHTPNGETVLDFGQNIAGIISFTVSAHFGQKMEFLCGEMLDQDGNFTQENIQLKRKGIVTPLQKIQYICHEGQNHYETKFAFFGFQYALYRGDVELQPEDVEAVAVYSDMEQTGFFTSSHPLLNQFVDATIWSAKGNHLDIPTDCPTRERHGWTGDAQIFFETASILFDFAAFSRKYLQDVFDWQKPNGKLPHIVPEGGADFYMASMNGSVGWADIGILIPYRYARIFGDSTILERYYDGMARYARFMESRCGKRMPIFAEHIKLSKKAQRYLVNTGQSYGEWAEPEDVCKFRWQDFVAPHPEVSTAYTAYVLGLMAEIAEELGHEADAREFRETSAGCRMAYQELVETKEYTLDTDRQARLVRGLYFHLLSDKQAEYCRKRLIQALENYGWRLGTGFLSTPLILDVLQDIDIEAAYKLLLNEEIPGWLSMPKNGATTIWENWNGPYNTQGAGLGSLNHYSKGAVCQWLFESMCGIQVDGENHFTIAPHPGGGMEHAQARYKSVYGEVSSGWKQMDTGYTYQITIPANCTATVILPGRDPGVYGPGSYAL